MARMSRVAIALVALVLVVANAETAPATARKTSLKMEESMKHKINSVRAKHVIKTHDEIMNNLRKDAENQKAIMAKKKAAGSDDTESNSMSPHLAIHKTRGEESVHKDHRGRQKTQDSIHGKLVLPPDEATPFFDTYVLRYAFPTIALICGCLACVLYRTMKMYQKERWKGTSYFHGARRSAESLLPGLK